MYFVNGWQNYISNIGHLSWNILDVKSGICAIDKRLFTIGGRAKLSSFAIHLSEISFINMYT